MSFTLWGSVFDAVNPRWGMRHAFSCISPSARCKLEEVEEGVLLAKGVPVTECVVCVDCDRYVYVVDYLGQFAQLRVAVSLDCPNRFLQHPMFAADHKKVLSIPYGFGKPMRMRQLETRGMGRPLCFDWWISRETTRLPSSLIVIGEDVDPGISADAFNHSLRTVVINSVALLPSSVLLPSVQHVHLHDCCTISSDALAVFPSMISLTVGQSVRRSAELDISLLAGCEKLQYLVLKCVILNLPTQVVPCFQRLRVLHLEACHGQWNWGWMGNMAQLESLYLEVGAGGVLTPPTKLPQLPGLRRLLTSSWHLGAGKEQLGGAKLEELEITQWMEASLSVHILGVHARLLTKITVFYNRRLSEIDVTSCTNLRAVVIQDCDSLELVRLRGCSSLAQVSIERCPTLAEIDGIDTASMVRFLYLVSCPSLQRLSLRKSDSLWRVRVDQCHQSLANHFQEHPRSAIRHLSLCDDHIRSLHFPAHGNLAVLQIRNCGSTSSVAGLHRLTCLVSLSLAWCGSIATLDFSGCTALMKLDISMCDGLQEMHHVSHLINLEMLRFSECAALASINLSGCESLTCFELSGCVQETAVVGAGGLKRLEKLGITDCQEAPVTINVEGCSSLHAVDLRGSDSVRLSGWPRDAPAAPEQDRKTALTFESRAGHLSEERRVMKRYVDFNDWPC